jgi:hypothetical protein
MTYQKINLMHVMLVGPLLTYIGFEGKKTKQIFYGALLGLTLMISFMVRTPGFKLNYRNSISWVHWIIWSSLFIYISFKQSELPDYMFEIIKYLGIITIIVHLYILYQYYK